MKHTTGKIYLISVFSLCFIVGCQTKDPWHRTYAIETYQNDFDQLTKTGTLDTFELHAFENYLLQHPVNAQGKSFKELFLESDSFRTVHRNKLMQAFLNDTLVLQRRNHLVPNPIDAPRQNVDFKVFLVNLKYTAITNLVLRFPGGAYRDSVLVDSLARLDSLHLAPHDSIVLYTYTVRYDNGSYRVGSSQLKEPLYASQISPPEFFLEDIQWQGQRKRIETVWPCEKNDVKLSLENGKEPEFVINKEVSILINVPCLDHECLLTAEASGATIKKEKSKQNHWVFNITPAENEFSLSVYSTCLPGSFVQSGKEKKSVSGKNLVQTLPLKTKKQTVASIRTAGIR